MREEYYSYMRQEEIIFHILGEDLFKVWTEQMSLEDIAEVLYFTEVWWNAGGVLQDCPRCMTDLASIDVMLFHGGLRPSISDRWVPRSERGFDSDQKKSFYVALLNAWHMGYAKENTVIGSHEFDGFTYSTWLPENEWPVTDGQHDWNVNSPEYFQLPIREHFEAMIQRTGSGAIEQHDGMTALWAAARKKNPKLRLEDFLENLAHHWHCHVIETDATTVPQYASGRTANSWGYWLLRDAENIGWGGFMYVAQLKFGNGEWDLVVVLQLLDRVLFLIGEDSIPQDERRMVCRCGAFDCLTYTEACNLISPESDTPVILQEESMIGPLKPYYARPTISVPICPLCKTRRLHIFGPTINATLPVFNSEEAS